jgi:four helix bundle protein
MRDYEKLEVYQLAEDLVVEVYRISKDFPSDERFGLTAHLRKTALSIPSNISEGAARGSDRDFSNFLNIAVGSTSELQCQLRIAYRLTFLEESTWKDSTEKCVSIRKMLFALMSRLSGR